MSAVAVGSAKDRARHALAQLEAATRELRVIQRRLQQRPEWKQSRRQRHREATIPGALTMAPVSEAYELEDTIDGALNDPDSSMLRTLVRFRRNLERPLRAPA